MLCYCAYRPSYGWEYLKILYLGAKWVVASVDVAVFQMPVAG